MAPQASFVQVGTQCPISCEKGKNKLKQINCFKMTQYTVVLIFIFLFTKLIQDSSLHRCSKQRRLMRKKKNEQGPTTKRRENCHWNMMRKGEPEKCSVILECNNAF